MNVKIKLIFINLLLLNITIVFAMQYNKNSIDNNNNDLSIEQLPNELLIEILNYIIYKDIDLTLDKIISLLTNKNSSLSNKFQFKITPYPTPCRFSSKYYKIMKVYKNIPFRLKPFSFDFTKDNYKIILNEFKIIKNKIKNLILINKNFNKLVNFIANQILTKKLDKLDKTKKEKLLYILVKEKILNQFSKIIIDKIENLNLFLIWAIKNNNLSISKYIITKQIDINMQNNYGDTILIYATEKNNLDLVKFLVKNGANINIQNNEGDTALTFAIINNNLDIVKYLVKHGANINIQNNNGFKPLTIAKASYKTDIVNFLKNNLNNLNKN